MTHGMPSLPLAGLTLLVIDDRLPEFDKHAGGQNMDGMLRALIGLGSSVTFLPHSRRAIEPYAQRLQQSGVQVLSGPFDVDEWLAIHGDDLDWVILARPTIAEAHLPSVRDHSRAAVVYYTHDLHALREERRYRATLARDALEASERMLTIEKRLFAEADLVLTPSPAEVAQIQDLVPGARVSVVPSFVEIAEASPDAVPMSERRSIVFVGGFQHPPNVDAARFLVEQVMPLIWASDVSALVYLVGKQSSPGGDGAGIEPSEGNWLRAADPSLPRAGQGFDQPAALWGGDQGQGARLPCRRSTGRDHLDRQ